jgi:riboflavin synthase
MGRELVVDLPDRLAPYVAEKGSIAVDGMSLTVMAVDSGSFTVALIPHTLEVTIAGAYKPGTRVNLEVDLLARYVERLLKQGG